MMLNMEELYLKDAAVKREDTVLSSKTDNVILTFFEEQNRILKSEYQDIEDQVVGFIQYKTY